MKKKHKPGCDCGDPECPYWQEAQEILGACEESHPTHVRTVADPQSRSYPDGSTAAPVATGDMQPIMDGDIRVRVECIDGRTHNCHCVGCRNRGLCLGNLVGGEKCPDPT